jgi:hypothetical protein
MILQIFPACEILRKAEDQAAFDTSVAGDETIAVVLLLLHAEVGAAMRDQLVGFLECAFIQQELDSFARRHFSLLVLALAPFRAAALLGQLVATLQFRNFFFKIHEMLITTENTKNTEDQSTRRTMPSFRR